MSKIMKTIAVALLGTFSWNAYSSEKKFEIWTGSLTDIVLSDAGFTGQIFGPTLNAPAIGLIISPSFEITFSPSLALIAGKGIFAPHVGLLYGFTGLRESTYYLGAEAGFLTVGGGAGLGALAKAGYKFKMSENVFYVPEIRGGAAEFFPGTVIRGADDTVEVIRNIKGAFSAIPLQFSIIF